MSKKRRKSGTDISEQQPDAPSQQPAGDEPVRLRLHTADECEPAPVEDSAAVVSEAAAPEAQQPEQPEAEAQSEQPEQTPADPEPAQEEGQSSADTEQPPAEAGQPEEAAEPQASAEALSQSDEVVSASGESDSSDEDADSEASGTADSPAAAGESTEEAGQLPEGEINVQQVIEAILFSTETPLTPQKIVSVLGVGSVRDVKTQITALNERYEREGAAFRIEKVAGGYQMLSMPQFNTWIRRLRQARQESRFSAAALETLAVVAYKQPVVRAEVEAIRGVSAGEMLNRLRELGLVKIVGRAEDVGRPMLYGTTKRFLELFGLASLEDLPSVEQLQPPK